jgi:hypothetical protein
LIVVGDDGVAAAVEGALLGFLLRPEPLDTEDPLRRSPAFAEQVRGFSFIIRACNALALFRARHARTVRSDLAGHSLRNTVARLPEWRSLIFHEGGVGATDQRR